MTIFCRSTRRSIRAIRAGRCSTSPARSSASTQRSFPPPAAAWASALPIPSDVARNVVDQLREHGRVARGWLGIQMQEVTPALARAVGLGREKGVLVDVVTKDLPAARGELKQGDVITAFNGTPIATPRDLAFAVAETPSGRTVPVEVWREGQQRTLDVTIAGERDQQKIASNEARPQGGRLGLELVPLTPDRRQELGLGSQSGVLVAEVAPGSAADQSGLQPGDVILGVGGRPVDLPDEAVSRIRAAESSNRPALPLLVMRDGTTSYLALELKPGAAQDNG